VHFWCFFWFFHGLGTRCDGLVWLLHVLFWANGPPWS
jgi:hypothetical protein